MMGSLVAKERSMYDAKLSFIYQDARGRITDRVISDISESDEYIQGHCHTKDELRTFRKDRILEILNNNDNANERLHYHTSVNPPPRAQPKSHDLLDVCFTGFKSDDKKRLIELAESKGFIVRSAVTQKLNFLCCGYNAGPKKIEKARSQGVIALNENQFIHLLETGEIIDT